MPKTHEMKESNFLKKEDVGRGALMTIAGCIRKNVAKEGAEPDLKWCLQFVESDKPMVLNATNIQLAEQITGSDDTDHWVGHKVVLYVDPNVSYGGKLIGGIRMRKPKPVGNVITQPVYAPVPSAEPVDEDDIPF
jgi:hypothetical protein